MTIGLTPFDLIYCSTASVIVRIVVLSPHSTTYSFSDSSAYAYCASITATVFTPRRISIELTAVFISA